MKRAILGMAMTMAIAFTPADNVNAGHPGSITDIVASSGGTFDRNKDDFDILLNAVLAAELESALADPHADLTVLAPTDRAFIRLARDLGFTGRDEAGAFEAIVGALTVLGDGDPIPVLRNILLYHVSAGSKDAADIQHTPVIETLLEGATILTSKRRLIDNDPDIRDPRLVRGHVSINANNGIINPITRVLIPIDIANTDNASLPTIAGIVATSGGAFDHNPDDFDLLLTALQAADLVGAVDNVDAQVTVLAPNDRAFIRLARDFGYHGHDEAGAFQTIVETLTVLGDGDPIPVLETVLLYHVLPEALPTKSVLESASLDTVQGATISPDLATRRLVDNEPALRDPRVKLASKRSFRASNGFVSTINRVLIPIDTPIH
ncbi:MAG: fasciclin domain-containing protein [Pseudomonadota bacterium]